LDLLLALRGVFGGKGSEKESRADLGIQPRRSHLALCPLLHIEALLDAVVGTWWTAGV